MHDDICDGLAAPFGGEDATEAHTDLSSMARLIYYSRGIHQKAATQTGKAIKVGMAIAAAEAGSHMAA